MFSSSLNWPIEVAGKFDREKYDIAESVIAELEADTSWPIKEVVDITAAGTGTVENPRNSRLHYRQLQGLARIGQLNNNNEKGEGAIDNLRGLWGEAIALTDFRSYPGVVVYEPVRQLAVFEQSIGSALIPGYQGNILKAFGDKTPDILAVQGQFEVPGGFIAPTLSNLVNPNNVSQVFDQPYPDKILVTAIEVTTANSRKLINTKSNNLASFNNPFIGDRNKVFVPILYVDKDEFNKLLNKQEIVDRMSSVGGYVMLKRDLRENASSLANNTAAIITNRVQALSNQSSNNIQNDKPAHIAKSPAVVAEKTLQPRKTIRANTENLPVIDKLDAQENPTGQPNYQLIVSKIMAKSAKYTPLGLDVRNEKDLNVAIAITSKVGGWDLEQIMQESPAGQNLSPEKKAAWIGGLTSKANDLMQPKTVASNTQDKISKPQMER